MARVTTTVRILPVLRDAAKAERINMSALLETALREQLNKNNNIEALREEQKELEIKLAVIKQRINEQIDRELRAKYGRTSGVIGMKP